MEENIKERLIRIINEIKPITNYTRQDSIFSLKYDLSPCDVIYILFKIEKEFNFKLDEDFIDSLEDSRFINIENLIKQYQTVLI